ncbi:6-phosphogluconate dehydrogenase [Flavobacterium sp.]|uniref:6-phosphogluconate dehydrogenase n=1 Tax=Flavobacterium sp. TaxID=239 RepID=UPI0028BEAD3C|nr:6-phosphogluconate dehydrogenase [Flavobacterium sp.]
MRKFIVFGLLSLALMFTAYFAFVYYVPYSEGVRAGELIKISKKGVMMKTWEGEISQGISGAQIFKFSVMDDDQKVIQQLTDYQGKYVKVNYIERYITFPWWGDSHYFITNVQLEDSPHFK